MSINKEWKEVEEGKDEYLSALLDMPVIMKLVSKDPVVKMRHAILINACWGLLIGGVYIYILLRFRFWQIMLCLAVVVIIILLIVARTLLLYRQLGRPAGTNNLLEELEQHYNKIRQWMNLQRWAGLVTYPFTVAGGFLLAAYLAGRSIDTLMQKKDMMLLLLIIELLLVPVCYYLAKWMNQKAFGQYAGQLKANIDSLKNEN